jgi:hypothetical protein
MSPHDVDKPRKSVNAMTSRGWCRRCLRDTRIVSGNVSDHPTHADVLCRECRREWRRLEGLIPYEAWLDLPPLRHLYWLVTEPEHSFMTPPALLALWLTARTQKQRWMEDAAVRSRSRRPERKFYAEAQP